MYNDASYLSLLGLKKGTIYNLNINIIKQVSNLLRFNDHTVTKKRKLTKDFSMFFNPDGII